jgi:3-phosphoglycerate kinase
MLLLMLFQMMRIRNSRCVKQIPDGWQGLDAGPKSLEIFKQIILDPKHIVERSFRCFF